MHQLTPKMKRQNLIHLLLAWLLLAASQHHYFMTIKVQAIDSVYFKRIPGQFSSRSHTEYTSPTWVEEKKIHKTPSGPNPVGNHRPPAKH